ESREPLGDSLSKAATRTRYDNRFLIESHIFLELSVEMIRWRPALLDGSHAIEQQEAHGIACFRGRATDMRSQEYVGKCAIARVDVWFVRVNVKTGGKYA